LLRTIEFSILALVLAFEKAQARRLRKKIWLLELPSEMLDGLAIIVRGRNIGESDFGWQGYSDIPNSKLFLMI